MNNKDIFNSIYENSIWHDPLVEVVVKASSGPGSNPKHAKEWTGLVNSFIKNNNIRSILDIGCGDWQLGKQLNLDNINYIGTDVSSFIIKQIKPYETNNIKFIEADAISMDFPKVDLIILKDVLQHLPIDSIKTIVDKVINSGSKYALISNLFSTKKWYLPFSKDDEVNIDIEPGDCTALDLKTDPFNYMLVPFVDMYINGFKQRVYLYDKETYGTRSTI